MGSPRTLSVGRRRRCWSSNWRLPCGIRSSNCGGSRENFMVPLPKRKPNRLAGYDYSQSGAYFITICAKGRHAIFGTVCVGRDDLGAPYVKLSEYGTVVENYICSIGQAYPNVTMEKFVVMPNHVHLLIGITRRENGAPRSSRPSKIGAQNCCCLKAIYQQRSRLGPMANLLPRPHRPQRGGLSPHLELYRHQPRQMAWGSLLYRNRGIEPCPKKRKKPM